MVVLVIVVFTLESTKINVNLPTVVKASMFSKT